MLLEYAWSSVQLELKNIVSGSMDKRQQLMTLGHTLDWYKKVLNLLRKIVEMESMYGAGEWNMEKRLKQLDLVEKLSDDLLQWSSKIVLFGKMVILKTTQLHNLFATVRQVAARQKDVFNSEEFIEESKSSSRTPSLHSKRSILRLQSEYNDERDTPYHFPSGFLKQHRSYWAAHVEHTGTLSFEQYLATHPLVLPERVKYLMANDVGTFAKLQSEEFPFSPPPQGVKYIHNWEERKKYEVYVQDGLIRRQKLFSVQFHTLENDKGEEGADLLTSSDSGFLFSAEMVSEIRKRVDTCWIQKKWKLHDLKDVKVVVQVGPW
jgi:hypothetical protein